MPFPKRARDFPWKIRCPMLLIHAGFGECAIWHDVSFDMWLAILLVPWSMFGTDTLVHGMWISNGCTAGWHEVSK